MADQDLVLRSNRLSEVHKLAEAALNRPRPSVKSLLSTLEQIEATASMRGPGPGPQIILYLPNEMVCDRSVSPPKLYYREDGTTVDVKKARQNKGPRGRFSPQEPDLERATILGMGTGRCGTQSLSRLLNLPHESHNPGKELEQFETAWEGLQKYNGDVGFYWISWFETALERNPELVGVCLQRDKEPCVISMMRAFCMEQRNAEAYWEWYRGYAEEMQREHPENFRIFRMEDVFSSGEDELLSWAVRPTR